MSKFVSRAFVSVLLIVFFLVAPCIIGYAAAAGEETIMGTLVKRGKAFVIEADDGDYTVQGKNLSKLVGKLVEVTGVITESEKGDTIEVKSITELEETLPD